MPGITYTTGLKGERVNRKPYWIAFLLAWAACLVPLVAPAQPVASEKKLEDPELLALLATSLKKKKGKKAAKADAPPELVAA